MALPVLPADGENPWGSKLRSALTDISNRADQGIATANAAQTELTGVHSTVTANSTTLTSYGTRLTAVENSNATKAADSAVVKLTGNQSIGGIKTFTSAPSVPDNSFDISKVNTLSATLNSLAPKNNPTFSGTVTGIDKAAVGLANVDNTADTAKPISTATQTALNLKANAADLTTQINTHNHTGGTNGVNLPVSAITGLQSSLDSIATKEPAMRVALTNGADITMSGSFALQYCNLSRWGRFAYISMIFTTRQSMATGNIANTLVASIRPTSEFYRVIDGWSATGYNGVQFSLSSTGSGLAATGVLYGVDPDGKKGTIYLTAMGSSGDSIGNGYELSLAGAFLLDNSTG